MSKKKGSLTLAAQASALLIGLGMLLAVAGCASLDSFGGSRQAVLDWGRERGFVGGQQILENFRLFSLQRVDPARRGEFIDVYIEGDGAAWPTPWHPPRDPTPQRPVALAMAAADPAPTVVYLGRPCQYLDVAELATCSLEYWTAMRFAPEVVSAYMTLLDRIKVASGAQRLRLFGYSGGGVIAALLTEKRRDVEQLVTVAAPLAVAEWTAWHGATPLVGSLDPAVVATGKLAPATHFVGVRDSVVPPRLSADFAARTGGRLREVPEFDHQCCWSRDWRRLLEEVR